MKRLHETRVENSGGETLTYQNVLSRRDLLQVGLSSGTTLLLSGIVGAASAALSGCTTAPVNSGHPDPNQFLKQFGPIDRTIPDISGTHSGSAHSGSYSGDQPERPHRILWDRAAYLNSKSIVGPEEQVPLVVVGGGVSGLFTTYLLRQHQPVLLEQASRFGGNAKGESWRGMDYSLGAAYIDEPRAGTVMRSLYEELGLSEILARREGSDPVEAKGKWLKNFWRGEAEPKHQNAYVKLENFFTRLNSEKTRAFPSIPTGHAAAWDSVRHFDQWSLRDLMRKELGGSIPAHLGTMLEHYCWSTYAASSTELSAAAALNFLAQESLPIRAGAGGNAVIAERLLQRLSQSISLERLRPSSIVVSVRVDGETVRVLYENAKGELKALRAKSAVLCCPKFVVAKILEEAEPSRLRAIQKLRYRSYMTANVWIDRPVDMIGYDLYLTGLARTDYSDIERSQREFNATDFVMANFASPSKSHTVLTLYRALPYDGGRRDMFEKDSYSRYRQAFEDQIAKQILPLLNLGPQHVRDLRLTRWGHALPMAHVGVYRGGVVDELRRPFKNRVFFVEQDNWACPALVTGALEASHFAPQVAKVLQG